MGSLAPVQYRLPFQYAGDPQMPGLAPWISSTICGSLLVQAGVKFMQYLPRLLVLSR